MRMSAPLPADLGPHSNQGKPVAAERGGVLKPGDRNRSLASMHVDLTDVKDVHNPDSVEELWRREAKRRHGVSRGRVIGYFSGRDVRPRAQRLFLLQVDCSAPH